MDLLHYDPESSVCDLLIELEQYRLVICKVCHYAVLPCQIDSHFAPKRPHGLSTAERQEIREYIKSSVLIQDSIELEEHTFEFPPDTSDPIPELGRPFKHGFRCALTVQKGACPYVTLDKKDIRRHCWEEHGWRRVRLKEGSSRDVTMPWRTDVQCQTFFRMGGPKSALFEVGRKPDPSGTCGGSRIRGPRYLEGRPLPSIGIYTIGGYWTSVLQNLCEVPGMDEATPGIDVVFRQRAGWVRHLRGLDWLTMLDLVKPVDEARELQLAIVHQALDGLVSKCLEAASKVDPKVMLTINQREVDIVPDEPFDGSMDPGELERYTTVWKNLISYIWRISNLSPIKKPAFKFTNQQVIVFSTLVTFLDRIQQPLEAGIPSRISQKARDDLESGILDWCLSLLQQRVDDDEYQSSIISGLAVLGVKGLGGWHSVDAYLPALSGVIKLAKLFIIYQGVTLHDRASCMRSQDEAGQEDRSRPVKSVLRTVQESMVQLGMIASLKIRPSPLSWIIETRRFGLDLQRRTAALGPILYSQDGCITSGKPVCSQNTSGQAKDSGLKRKRSASS